MPTLRPRVLPVKPVRPHEAVVILTASPSAKGDRVEHPVAVEGVVALDRRQQRVFGVAQVDTGEVSRDLALDVEIPRVVFDGLRPPRAGAVRVLVVLGELRLEALVDLDLHR